MESKRDVTFDIMKGVAILAMIAGHCFIPLKLHHFIYIWHMPLFFMVSGYFFHDKPLGRMMGDNVRGLIIPYLIANGVILCGALVMDMQCGTNILIPKFVGALAINGLMHNPDAYGGLYKSSPLWFLLGLLWCRVFYATLHRYATNVYIQGMLCVCLSWGIAAFQAQLYLPFYILQGLVSVVFYHAGYLLKQHIQFVKQHKNMFYVLTVAALILGMMQQGLDIWALLFHNWILNVVAAIETVILMYLGISDFVHKIDSGGAALCFRMLSHLGRWSLLLLALHSFEKSLDISSLFMDNIDWIAENSIAYRLLKICLQFGFCFIGLILLEQSHLVRKLFNVK